MRTFIGHPFTVAYNYIGRVTADPLVHRGRHFGRAIFAFANVKSLIMNGLDRMADDQAPDPETLSAKYNLLLSIPFQWTDIHCLTGNVAKILSSRNF